MKEHGWRKSSLELKEDPSGPSYMFANTYTYNGSDYVPTSMGRVEYQSKGNIRANLQEALVSSNDLHSKTFPPCKLSFIPWLQTQNSPALKQVLPLCGVWLCSVQHWFKSMSQRYWWPKKLLNYCACKTYATIPSFTDVVQNWRKYRWEMDLRLSLLQ